MNFIHAIIHDITDKLSEYTDEDESSVSEIKKNGIVNIIVRLIAGNKSKPSIRIQFLDDGATIFTDTIAITEIKRNRWIRYYYTDRAFPDNLIDDVLRYTQWNT